MSGFISHVIFIWPEWDKKDYGKVREDMMMSIGYYRPDPFTSNKSAEFCMCEVRSTNLCSS